MRFALRLTSVLLVAVLCAAADTIVLKSGRRITATNVVEEGDRVYYETRSGRFSFPRSAVERVERGPAGDAGPSEAASAPANAPRVDVAEGYGDIARAAVHDGAIDVNYIARLESEARTGGDSAARKQAVAHHAAAQLEVRRGDLGSAIDHYRRGPARYCARWSGTSRPSSRN